MSKNILTQEDLKGLFSYNQDTGVFERLKAYNGAPAGVVSCKPSSNGYLRITINSKLYYQHRLAWLYMTGKWPSIQIDHIDHNKTNNRFYNLRLVSYNENARNKKLSKANTTGITGVYWREDRNKWQATISANGKYKYLGDFKDINDAIIVRKNAEIKYGYHDNHGVMPKT